MTVSSRPFPWVAKITFGKAHSAHVLSAYQRFKRVRRRLLASIRAANVRTLVGLALVLAAGAYSLQAVWWKLGLAPEADMGSIEDRVVRDFVIRQGRVESPENFAAGKSVLPHRRGQRRTRLWQEPPCCPGALSATNRPGR